MKGLQSRAESAEACARHLREILDSVMLPSDPVLEAELDQLLAASDRPATKRPIRRRASNSSTPEPRKP